MVTIELYTKDQCPLCENVKNFLQTTNLQFKEQMVGRDITREAVLEKFPGTKLVPIIVLDGNKFPGSADDFVTLMSALKQYYERNPDSD